MSRFRQASSTVKKPSRSAFGLRFLQRAHKGGPLSLLALQQANARRDDLGQVAIATGGHGLLGKALQLGGKCHTNHVAIIGVLRAGTKELQRSREGIRNE